MMGDIINELKNDKRKILKQHGWNGGDSEPWE